MFFKNIKSIMTITMLLIMSLGSVVLFADCDMMAMQSKTNFLISNIEDPDGDTPNDFDDPVDYFDYIRERSADYYSSYSIYVNDYKENDDLTSGIHDAITQTDIEGCNIRDKIESPDPSVLIEENGIEGYINVTNFVLSDGENLYIFRNSPSVDVYHELSYKDNDTFYSVKTLDPRGGELIDQFDLVKISRDEDPIEFPNFLDIDVKTFYSGVHWESFPRIGTESNGNIATDLVDVLDDIEPFIDIENINLQADETTAFELTYDLLNFWYPDQYLAQSSWLYKIEIAPEGERFLIIDGERLPVTFDLSDEDPLESGTYHWLGYWIPRSQNIVDAFGDYWQYVENVKSEDWYFSKRRIIRGDGPQTTVSWSTENKTLEYGKGYMVLFIDTPPITNFHWTESGESEEPVKKATSESFTYTEKPDYEVIDVINIPEVVTEIGVFEEDECVGAVVVEDSCAQILVYSDNANRDPVPFNFEIVTGRGESSSVRDYEVFNQRTWEFESGIVISGMQEYSIVRLGEEGELEDNIPSVTKLHSNYPNPFNPATTISFSLPKEENIELTIYNIKGQKVKQLVGGQLSSGQHSVIWDGKDSNGKEVSSGLYFYKLKTAKNELTSKMLMLK